MTNCSFVLLWLSCKCSLIVNKWFIAHKICKVLFGELFFVVLFCFLDVVFTETPKITNIYFFIFFEEFHNVETIYFLTFCTYKLFILASLSPVSLLPPTSLSCSCRLVLFYEPLRLTWPIPVTRDLELPIGACWPQQATQLKNTSSPRFYQ